MTNHDKFITTPDFNTLAAGLFNVRLPQVDLVTKTYFYTKLKKKTVTKLLQINPNVCLLKMNLKN